MLQVTLWELLAIVGASFAVGVAVTALFAWVAGRAWVQNVEDSRTFGRDCVEHSKSLFAAGTNMLARGTAFFAASRKNADPASMTPGLDALAAHELMQALARSKSEGRNGHARPAVSDRLEPGADGFIPEHEENPHIT